MDTSKKQKILLIDDEPDITELIKFHLDNKGYEVKIASNGLEGDFDCNRILSRFILLDVMMPEMDGVEVCQKLKENSKNQRYFNLFF